MFSAAFILTFTRRRIPNGKIICEEMGWSFANTHPKAFASFREFERFNEKHKKKKLEFRNCKSVECCYSTWNGSYATQKLFNQRRVFLFTLRKCLSGWSPREKFLRDNNTFCCTKTEKKKWKWAEIKCDLMVVGWFPANNLPLFWKP